MILFTKCKNHNEFTENLYYRIIVKFPVEIINLTDESKILFTIWKSWVEMMICRLKKNSRAKL